MKTPPKWTATVDAHGKLHLDTKRDLDRYLRTLVGKEVEITVAQKHYKRSRDQNALWWGFVVPPIADHCGYTANQMHYALLGECFGYIDGPQGKPVPVKPSSAELTKEEFTHLIEWALDFAAAELGVYIDLKKVAA